MGPGALLLSSAQGKYEPVLCGEVHSEAVEVWQRFPVRSPLVAEQADRRKRFLDEAKAASMVSDAHIVQVHEFGQEGDLDFIVMEYVDGNPLNSLNRKGGDRGRTARLRCRPVPW